MNDRPIGGLLSATLAQQPVEIDWGDGERSLSIPADHFTLNVLTDMEGGPSHFAVALRVQGVGIHVSLSDEEALRLAGYINDCVAAGKA